MNARIICLIFAIAFLTITAQAQPEVEWVRTFGGEGRDFCYSAVQLYDSSYMFAGYTSAFGAGRQDYWLVNLSKDGDSIWSRTLGGEEMDICRSLVQTSSGNLVLSGKSSSFDNGGWDVWLVSLNSSFDSLWSRSYGSNNYDECSSIIETHDGGNIIAGQTSSFGAGEQDMWLVKINSEGDSLWAQTYGTESAEYCNSIIQIRDGGFAFTGRTSGAGEGWGFNMMTIAVDENGEMIWSSVWGGDGYDEGFSILQTEDEEYLIGGRTAPSYEDDSDFWLVKLDYYGNYEWSRTFGGEEDEVCKTLLVTQDNCLLLAGETESFGAGGKDYWLLKTNLNGDSLWSMTFGTELDESLESGVISYDGGFILAGRQNHRYEPDANFYLVKTTPDPVSVRNLDPVYPSSLILYPSYPNPFNAMTRISFEQSAQSAQSAVQLSIFDPLGRRVADLIPNRSGDLNRHYGATVRHSAIWNADRFPAGTYFVHLESNGQSLTEPIRLVR